MPAKIANYELAPEMVEAPSWTPSRSCVRPARTPSRRGERPSGPSCVKWRRSQARFVSAIAAAGNVTALVVAIEGRERDRDRLNRDLAELEGLETLSSGFDPQSVERALRKKLDDWRGLLRRQTPLARQVPTQLLAERIVWTPNKEEGRYEFAGRVKYDRLLSGVVFTRGVVAVRGIEPRSHG